MSHIELKESILKTMVQNIAIKVFVIFIVGLVYLCTLGHVHAATNINKSTAKNGVCVFDIDFTLQCDGAIAAVEACKAAGFELAINTARNKQDAYKELYNGMLLRKGFSQEFIDVALNQQGLNGPFQYSASNNNDETYEQRFQGKSYAMRNIAKYYNYKLDDRESRKLILFDDLYSNINQIQPNMFDDYNRSRCISDFNQECFSDLVNSPNYVSYPRNWKIYRGLYIGSLCSIWTSKSAARQDAIYMINQVIYDRPRLALPLI